MWAVTNDHCDIVETLLEYNASVDTKSFNGTSVYDLINIENERMIRMLPTVKVPVSSFIWDQCLPDQMFVFTEEQLDSILTVAITEFQLPIKSRSEIYVPASVIFLCARYAHYYVTKDLVHALLTNSVNRIQHVIDVCNKKKVIIASLTPCTIEQEARCAYFGILDIQSHSTALLPEKRHASSY